MKTALGRSSAAAMVFAGTSMRLFWGMAVDYPAVHISAWICPLLGFLLFLPLGFAIIQGGRLVSGSPWENLSHRCPRPLHAAASALLAAVLLYDCAVNLRLLASTANVLALGEIPVHLLLIPPGVLLAVSVLLGADAAGNNARIWLHILPLLLAITAIAHFSSYELSWLTPILGSGAGSILSGSIYCGGCIALMCLPWMLAVPDRCKKTLFLYSGSGALLAALLLAALQMLCPALPGLDLTRSSRTELVLNNGRTVLSMQILLIVLWYGGLMQIIAAEGTACAGFLRHMLPKAPLWNFSAGESIAALVLAGSVLSASKTSTAAASYYFPLIAVLLLILMLAAQRRRRVKPCAG